MYEEIKKFGCDVEHTVCGKDIYIENAYMIHDELVFDVFQSETSCTCKLTEDDFKELSDIVLEFFMPRKFNA